MIPLPSALTLELTRMRREASNFTVVRMVGCRFCTTPLGAYALGHPLNLTDAGTWCHEHGWTTFDSSHIPCDWEVRARGAK